MQTFPENLPQFIPVPATPVGAINSLARIHLVNETNCSVTSDKIGATLGLDQVTSPNFLNVFRWHDPLLNSNQDEFPERLRSFSPIGEISAAEITQAKLMIQRDGPFIPRPNQYYSGEPLNRLEEKRRQVCTRTVPDHQGRGFRFDGIYYFQNETRSNPSSEIKLTVCTKGTGTCGYWEKRRQTEMLAALTNNNSGKYPLNPDAFHARDHKGQSTGQKHGDEIVWVGLASAEVTKREVEGFGHYADAGIYSPICLPVHRFDELPLATGQFIDAKEFVGHFDPDAQLVVLGKAWTLETRIWGNHFSHEKMTAAHLASTTVSDKWTYETILDDLQTTASTRKAKLEIDEAKIQTLLCAVEPKNWKTFLGRAGEVLALKGVTGTLANKQKIIPTIMSINMIENVARAGANRLWGKPVAWHLENIGRLGEVSGGERIYGLAKGQVNGLERHSFFAYLFDAYAAVSIEWATANQNYCSIDSFYNSIRARILELNPNHWTGQCESLDQLVLLCQKEKPNYEVKFRSEDAYPLVAVPGTTSETCTQGEWKDWHKLKTNLHNFICGIRSAYSQK